MVGAAVGALDHLDAVVGRVHDPQRERVAVGDERVPDAHRHDLAVGADADRADAVVALVGHVVGAAGAVVVGGEVARQISRFVVVVEEVPAGDVVGEAVVVVVEVLAGHALRDQVGGGFDLASAEGVDEVLPGDQARGPGATGVGEAHARVLRVVGDVDDAVAVAVEGPARGAVGVLGIGQLAGVEVDLLAQLRVAPHDAGVEDGHDGVGATPLGLPGPGRVEARDHRFAGVRADGVDRARRQLRGEAEPVEVLFVEVR